MCVTEKVSEWRSLVECEGSRATEQSFSGIRWRNIFEAQPSRKPSLTLRNNRRVYDKNCSRLLHWTTSGALNCHSKNSQWGHTPEKERRRHVTCTWDCAFESVSWSLCLWTMGMEAFSTRPFLRFFSTISTVSSSSPPLWGRGDAPPATLAYIYRGSGCILVIQWTTENGIPTLRYKQRPSKSTLHDACPRQLRTGWHGFPEQYATIKQKRSVFCIIKWFHYIHDNV